MRAQRTSGVRPPGPPGWVFWRRGRERKASAKQAERLLDLAGFADGRLDGSERERVATLIARDPDAAADVAAARRAGAAAAPAVDERVLARAVALVAEAGEYGRIVSFPERRPPPRQFVPRPWHDATAWGSLAAAIALASWLGFNLGSGMSVLRPASDPMFEDAATSGLLDPAPALLRDFTEGWRT